MPLDATLAPAKTLTHQNGGRPVAVWLFAICAMLLVMIVLGGTTRLTGSGLSIMEWAPLSGTLPPLSQAEWQRLFALYRTIPQFHLLHPTMGLPAFQNIFWLEWVHRLWGRLLGLAFFVPLVWFAATGRIGRALLPRLAILFILGGLQGAVGWFMVASGFMANSASVSAYRLVVHLALALFLYAAILWTALTLARPTPIATQTGQNTRRLAIALLASVCLTILAGGFVAGLHAGLTYNTFPLMDGRLIPAGYAAESLPRGWFENIAAVQFNHRLLATLSATLALATIAVGWRHGPAHAKKTLGALAAIVTLQYALGVATLLLVVPIPLAAAHQATAVLLLTVALALVHRLRAAGCTPAAKSHMHRMRRHVAGTIS